jgi:hypothetical protein
MRRIRACAAAAAWIPVIFLLPACSVLQLVEPPPLVAEPPPQPPPLTLGFRPLSPPTPEEAYAEIVRWFKAAGYNDFQIAALAEHARTESGFRACARGPGDLSYTFQWGGTRLRQLHEFARTDGCPQLDKQLAFADKELRNDPKYACFWSATTEPSAYAALRRGFGQGSC